MENQILIFRTSITKRRDIKLIGSLWQSSANHPMECRFRGLGEGIKNRVQQYHRTRDFGNTPE